MKKEENIGLLVTLKAKKGKESSVKDFLLGGLEIVNGEEETVSWFAYQIDDQTFGIFDTKSIKKADIVALDIKKGNQDIGLLVTLQAKKGKEDEVESFLKVGQTIVHNKEPKTVSWYAVNLGEGTFAIFDTSHDEEGRLFHLNGEVAAALMEKAPEILEDFKVDDIKKIDVLAAK